MSRFRLGSIAAFAGILITTGGCAGSATAPEAATARGTAVSQAKTTKPAPTPPEAGTEAFMDDGGVILNGGGR
jgi:hypothetical protein